MFVYKEKTFGLDDDDYFKFLTIEDEHNQI